LLCVSPQGFQLVVVSVLLVEDVDDNVNEVCEYPLALLVAGHAKTRETVSLCEYCNLVTDGSALAVTCAGGDYEEVCRRAYSAEVDYHYISAVKLKSDPGRLNSEFFTVY